MDFSTSGSGSMPGITSDSPGFSMFPRRLPLASRSADSNSGNVMYDVLGRYARTSDGIESPRFTVYVMLPGAAVMVVWTAGTREGFCPATCEEDADFCAVTFCATAAETTKIVNVRSAKITAENETRFISPSEEVL